MKKLLAILCSLIVAACGTPGPLTPDQQEIEIDSVIKDVQRALANAQTELRQQKLPALKTVTLNLQTAITAKGGGKLKVVIVTVGASREKSKTQEVTLVLTPPRAGNAKEISAHSLTEGLEQAIVAAARGVMNADKDSTIPLKLTTLKVKLGFTVKEGGSGGASREILPITLELSGDLSRTDVQILEIVYEEKA